MSPTPDHHGFASEYRTAVAAAEEAGALLRSRVTDGFAARAKGERGDVVTDLDLMAERLVVDRIRADFPHDRILAEEGGELRGDGGGGRTWLVDPLDGTNNVVIGLPVYVVGVALCVDAVPVVGVVHDPVACRTWSARLGGGAQGPHGPLAAGTARPLPAAGPLLAWTQGHAVGRDDVTARTLRQTLELRSRRLLQLWAPLVAWAMLARGDIDGFVGYRAEAIDLPAGALLAREAGIAVRHLDGREFTGGFTGPDSERSFVAGRVEVLPGLLELVAAAGLSSSPGRTEDTHTAETGPTGPAARRPSAGGTSPWVPRSGRHPGRSGG